MNATSLLTIARPYIKAAFNFACDHSKLKEWELMLTCAKNIIKHPVIIKLLSMVHYVRSEELSEIFILISQHKLDCFGQNFIRILAQYKRLCLIPIILDEFLVLCHKKEKIVEIKIISSVVLKNEQILKIVSIMQKMISCKINIIQSLDRSINGGIIFRINDFVIDGSIQNRIKRLKHVLKN